MANDRIGNPLSVGDIIAVAGRVVKIEGTRAVVSTERGLVTVETSDTYPIESIVGGDGRYPTRWVGRFGRLRW